MYPPIRSRFSYFALPLVLVVFAPAIANGQTFSFSNTANITVNNNAAANPYPSTINVSGLCCSIAKVTVTLNNVTHDEPDDLDVVLVGPTGAAVAVLQDSGGANTVTNQTWTFDDAAAAVMADAGPVATGTFKPSDGAGANGSLPAPAPVVPYSVLLSDYIGTAPNGTWRLYVADDTNTGTGGNIAGGWTISITVGRVVSNATSITVPATGTGPSISSPYPSTISVAGSGLVTKITVKINNFSHTWPEDVAVLLVGPLGQKVILMADTGGGTGTQAFANANITFDDAAANFIPQAPTPPPSTFKPTKGDDSAAGGSDPIPANLPSPAPAGPYATALSVFNGTDPNGTWSLYVYDDTAADSGSIAGGWTLIIESLNSSAANVEVSGRAVTAAGRGIANAVVTLSGSSGDVVYAITNPFGYYAFREVAAGPTYIVTVTSKRYKFAEPVRVVQVSDPVTSLDFVALE